MLTTTKNGDYVEFWDYFWHI